jgi:hypothetical protein
MATIKDRIKKLLALAQSPNENEARAALLKARELMAKYKLTEEDVSESAKGLVNIVCNTIKWTSDSGDIWMTELAKVICENQMCAASWSVEKGHRTYTLCITGFEEDVEVCKVTMEYATDFVRSAIKRIRRGTNANPKAVSKSYAHGFIFGLELAYEEQNMDHPEWALVVQTPKEVQEFSDRLGTKTVGVKDAGFDYMSYMKGQKDGQEFSRRKVIDEK